jgi:hypothetical protein
MSSLTYAIGFANFIAASIFIFPNSALANPNSQCAFNGKREACTGQYLMVNGRSTGIRVRWLSDGKVVSYNFYGCVNEEFGGGECKVKIVEDNGRVAYGKSFHGGRGTRVISSNGNITDIYPF